MCLLTYLPAGTMPDVDALQNGAWINDDGHGYAIVDVSSDRRRIITGRGFDSRDMIEEFAVMRELYPDGPALFHSRFATDGFVSLLNCHPFEIGGDSRTVLAHNGIMPIRPPKDDPRSDTRIVAESFIPRAYGSLRRRRARLAFERWLTKYNKVVILTVDRRFRENGFILNESSGTWIGGIWYSNDGFRPYYYGKSSGTSGAQTWPTIIGGWADSDVVKEKVDICWICKLETDWRLGECPQCGVCFDCAEMPENCFCYTPSKAIDGSARALPAAPQDDFLAQLSNQDD